jgi:zinc transport system permease protein
MAPSFITHRVVRLMLDDFFVRALLAGVGIALISGPLGCFVIWRRMAYFGDTMAHSALLGVTLSLITDLNTQLGVFAIVAAVAIALLVLRDRAALPSDTILGILSHSTLAIGLVAIALMGNVRVDLMSYLFGDILAVSKNDVLIVYACAAVGLAILMAIWRPLLSATVNEELAQAESQKPQLVQLVFLLLLASIIAIAIKIVGILLITALLVIPAATARRVSTSPEQMAFFAAIAGVLSTAGGLLASLTWDTPSGPGIVVTALVLFLLGLTVRSRG